VIKFFKNKGNTASIFAIEEKREEGKERCN